MMRRLKTMLISLAALLAPAAALAQRTEITPPAGPWSPPQVAVSFPETIGEYRRGVINQFDSRNHGVSYSLERNGQRLISITIFVYALSPAPTCQEEFDASAASIVRSNPTATRVTVDRAASPRGTAGAALHARYAYATNYAGALNTPIHSDLYVYCKPGSAWIVKARSSWPANTDMSRETATVLRGINWSSEVTD